MSRHSELKCERRKLVESKMTIQDSITRVEQSNKVFNLNLSSLDDDFEKSVDKAKNAALAEEINKHTFKHTEILGKLQSKREEILSNRDKKLENITYENMSKKTKSELSVEYSIEKVEEIKSKLDEKMGKRLSSELSRIIPSKGSFNTISKIKQAFDELEYSIDKLGKDLDIVDRLEKIAFSFDTSSIEGNSTIYFILVILIIFVSLLFFMPLLVLLLVALFIYNIHRSIIYYDAMSISKILISNVNKINSSLEEGIKNKVKFKRNEVENKFKSMLDKVDRKIETVEDLISNTTAEIESDFNFNDSVIMENYKSKKDSISEQISKNNAQIESYKSEIESIDMKIKEIDEEILEVGKTIFSQYYPNDLSFEDRSSIYLEDILLDIQNSEPNIFTLPRGSAVFLYKDESSLMQYLNLYLCSIYSRMKPSSFYVKMIDLKYAGTKLLEFNSIDSFTSFLTPEEIKEDDIIMRQEILKRTNVIGSKHIDDYNLSSIEDNGSPLSYYIILDLFRKPEESDTLRRQSILTGFNYGVMYNLFLNVKDIEEDKRCVEYLLNNYSEYYYITDSGVSKKSSKFMQSLLGDSR